MMGISAIIKTFFESLSNFFSYAETSKEHQAETEIIKDRKKLEKAADVSEEILMLAVKYKKIMTQRDQRKLLKLIRKFNKND